jgi:hypothetical protein
MIGDAIRVVAMLWVTGTALSVLPTLEARARLTRRDPAQMCGGCRARRQAQERSECEWRKVAGSAGTALMILAAATLWWAVPLLSALRQLAGSSHQTRCVGRRCAAHFRYDHLNGV